MEEHMDYFADIEYKEFKEKVAELIEGKLSAGMRVCLRQITKNNSVVLDSLSIICKGDDASPVIYLNDYYRKYLDGVSIEDIAENILVVCRTRRIGARVDINRFANWETASGRIVPRLVSKERNTALLKEIPHKDFLDLAIIYAYLMEGFDEGNASITIRNEHIQMWEKTEEEIRETAFQNMDRLIPMEFISMQEMLNQLLHQDRKETDISHPMLYILTSKNKSYGAVWICREDKLENIRMESDSDYLILPSSVHECILLPVSEIENAEGLSDMVSEINDTEVEEEDVLGNTIYLYSRKEKRLRIAFPCEQPT